MERVAINITRLNFSQHTFAQRRKCFQSEEGNCSKCVAVAVVVSNAAVAVVAAVVVVVASVRLSSCAR